MQHFLNFNPLAQGISSLLESRVEAEEKLQIQGTRIEDGIGSSRRRPPLRMSELGLGL